jgi:alpha-N-arabinofuranosidase
MVRGYQGNDLAKNNTIMACVKHIALYGAGEAGRDYNTVDMSHLTMFNDYFPPYRAAFDERAGSGMLTAQTARFSSFSYKGEDARFDKRHSPQSQYLNPILAGFYPDPSVCRKSDTYYLVNSTFATFPGVPLFTSKDLVNWTQIGHVLDRESQAPLYHHDVSEGIFAPAISYNKRNKTFYMVTMNMGERSVFYVKTQDPAKGWSEPVQLKAGGMDPSFFFDRDGKAYMVYSTHPLGGQQYPGEMAIHMNEFSVSGDSVCTRGVELVRGGTHPERKPVWLEGPHLYRIGKFYYLMCAEGGTTAGHSEVIFRSKSLQGPWEAWKGNPILSQSTLTASEDVVSSTGHADLIQTPTGDWWAVFLGCRPYEDDFYNTGRDSYLLPVTWKDGWPVILETGKAVPTVVEKKGLLPADNRLTGNFAFTDSFNGEHLNQTWIYLRNPDKSLYSIDEKGLSIKAASVNIWQKESPSAVFHRQQHATFTAETVLDFVPSTNEELAGMVLMQNEKYNFVFGKTLVDGKPAVTLTRTEKETVMTSFAFLSESEAKQALKLKIVGNERYYGFQYQAGEGAWQTIAQGVDAINLSTSHAGGFIGTLIGLYASSNHKLPESVEKQ